MDGWYGMYVGIESTPPHFYGVESDSSRKEKKKKRWHLSFFFSPSHITQFVICYLLFVFVFVFSVCWCMFAASDYFFLLDDPDPCTQMPCPTSTPSPPSLAFRGGGFFFWQFFFFHFVKKNQSGME